MPHPFIVMAASVLLIAAAEPPAKVPVPEEKPPIAAPSDTAQEPKADGADRSATPVPDEKTVPKPEGKPAEAQTPDGNAADDAKTGKGAPGDTGTTSQKKGEEKSGNTETGDKPAENPAEGAKAEGEKVDLPSGKPEPEPEPVKQEDPDALKACLAELTALGAGFRQIDPIKGDEPGCGVASPLEVDTVLPGIALEPKGTMRCAVALSLSRWTRDVVVPAAKIAMPDRKLTGYSNASTYICRNRNSAETGKISEHARGNALDIASMSFDKGEPLVMKPRGEDGTVEGALQRTITAAACLFFRTVLSPGSDATHQDHLHMDMLERKGGFLYCR